MCFIHPETAGVPASSGYSNTQEASEEKEERVLYGLNWKIVDIHSHITQIVNYLHLGASVYECVRVCVCACARICPPSNVTHLHVY